MSVRLRSTVVLAVLMLAGPGCRLFSVSPLPVGDQPGERLHAAEGQLQRDGWQRNHEWSPLRDRKPQSASGPTGRRFRWMLAEVDLDRVVPDPPDQLVPDPDQIVGSGDSLSSPETELETPSGSETSTKPGTNSGTESGTKPDAQPVANTEPDAESDAETESGQSSTIGAASQSTLSERTLALLSRRDDLIGWNAAILYARHYPQQAAAAAHVAGRLEELASNPPAYHPDTKRRIRQADGGQPAGSKGFLQRWFPQLAAVAPAGEHDANRAAAEKAEASGVPISSAMQAAAAEAWCLVLSHSDEEPAEALAPAGWVLERSDLPAGLREELFRGVAETIAPVHVPHLADVLRPGRNGERAPVALRRAAVESCLSYAVHSTAKTFDPADWPAGLVQGECLSDPDATVRQAYGQWLAVVRHPEALEILKSQRLDVESSVRDAALLSLGLLGTEPARAELRGHTRDSNERVRQLAVRGLAHGGVQEIAPSAQDPAYSVRRTVAQELAAFPQPDSALILHALLVDGNPQVQAAAVEALADWPDALAAPLLLHGLRDGFRPTRQACLDALRQRTAAPLVVKIDGSRQERAQQAAEIARKANLSDSLMNDLRRDGLQPSRQAAGAHAAEVESYLQEVAGNPPQSAVHAAAMQRLQQLAAEDVPIIEKFLAQAGGEVERETVYRDVLPKLSRHYAALRDLQSSDVFVRRRGAQTLAQLAGESTLSRQVVRRLYGRLVEQGDDRLAQPRFREHDQLVWRYAMAAVMQDDTDEGAKLAWAALLHTWPDIRVLGCRYLERHGRPQYAVRLLPLLHDPNRTVQLAAVAAAPNCRSPLLIDGMPGDGRAEPVPGLKSLLTHADPRVRFAAVAALTRMNDPQGVQELLRMSYHDNAAVRVQVVEEMGRTGEWSFVDHLIRLGWTEPNETVKRAVLDSLAQLVPPEQRPPGLAEQSTSDGTIREWAAWRETRNGNRR